MRASIIQGNVRDLERLPKELADRVRARIQPGVLADVQRAGRLAWLPLDHDIEISEAVYREADAETLRHWARVSLRTSLDGPLLRPLMAAGRRLFGVSPAARLRVLPKRWEAAYRGVGSLTYEGVSSTEARLLLKDLPPVLFERNAYLESITGSFEAVFDVCEVEGSVVLEDCNARNASARYLAKWRHMEE